MIEQVLGEVGCPSCSERAQVKERPVVRHVDLSVYRTPMHLHRPGQVPLSTASTHRLTCCARRTAAR
jgi:DNA-directed RNA polymerase subunit RPC12/RpoP